MITREQFDRMMAIVEGHSYVDLIARMNRMYRLPVNDDLVTRPNQVETGPERLLKFKATLLKEIEELDRDILPLYEKGAGPHQILVALADWLADLDVYIRSEAMKFGIPHEDVRLAVMASNFTKLPDDGIPVYDENGKFEKDLKNFVPPEPAIAAILFGIDS